MGLDVAQTPESLGSTGATAPPEEQTPLPTDILSTPQAGTAAVHGAVLRMGAFAGGALFSVGSAAILFRHLGVIDTGRYTTAMSLSAMITGLTDLGLTGMSLRELSILHGEQRASFVRNLLGMRLVLAVAGVLVITLFALAAYGTLLALGVLIAGCGVLIQNTQSILAVSLAVRMRLGWVSSLEFARQFLAAGAIALLVLAGAHLLALLAVTAIAASIVLSPTIALVRGDIPLRPSFDTRRWRVLVAPMLTYSAAAIATTLYLRVAIVLVSLLGGGRQLGYFSVSYRVVENLFILSGLLVGSAFPIFAYAALDDPARLGYAVSRVFEASVVVGVWISLSLAVGARLVIEIVGGKDFMPAVPVLAIQGVAVAAIFVSTVWSSALLSLHLHREILILYVALFALVATGVAVLAPLYGAEGAAAATAAVEIVAAIAGAVVLAHGRPHLRPRLQILPKVTLATAIGASPMLLESVPIVGRLALSTILYAAILASLGALPSELRTMLPLQRKA
jgi:O-antigen/teichoic acid export membrane protein